MRWKTTKLGDVLTIQNGYAFNSKSFSNTDGTPLIRIRDLKNGIKTETNYNGIYDNKFLVNAGDLLIGMDGEFGCYEWKGKPSLLNQRVCRLMDFSNQLLPRFLFYGINQYLKEIESKTVFITVKHISSKQIKDIPFPIPPLSVQKQIVEKLDAAFAEIDKAISATEKNIENAESFIKKYISDLFQKNVEALTPKYLADISENLDSKRKPIAKSKRLVGEIPYYGASGKVDSVKDFIFDEDLLLVSEDGANLLARTYPIAFSISGRSWVNNHAHVLRFKDKCSQKFVEYYLNSISIEKWVTGMAQPKLNQKKLNEIPIPFPNKPEQINIIKSIDALQYQTNKVCQSYKRKLELLTSLKFSILNQALSGELTKDVA